MFCNDGATPIVRLLGSYSGVGSQSHSPLFLNTFTLSSFFEHIHTLLETAVGSI